MKDILGKAPIFLLDDIFGELDAYRVSKISKYLKKIGQAFITLTDFGNIDNLSRSGDDLVLEVKNGTIYNAERF